MQKYDMEESEKFITDKFFKSFITRIKDTKI